MDDVRFGRTVRMVRVKRGLRQRDVAERAGVSASTVSRLECGHLGALSIAVVRRICRPLELSVDLAPRSRGADLHRMLSAAHSSLHESVARALARWAPGWEVAHEVSFNVWGERGVIDLLLWHPGRRALLIVELKSELVDHGALLATMDRRRRLAGEIVADRGWLPASVSTWVIVTRSRTTERRIADHRTVLRSVFPSGERGIRAWLREPIGEVNALSTWKAPEARGSAPARRVHGRR